ncbi:MAG: diguanylate cyclase [Spirochaetia bacterium]
MVISGERLRCAIEGAYIMYSDERLAVTVSLGGAVFRPGESAADLVRRADEALYASKRAGRNRLTIAPEL